jgi:hypothetical protein
LSAILYASVSLYALSASAEVTIVASGDDCAATGSTCHWELNSDGKLSITGSGAMKDNTSTSIDDGGVNTSTYGSSYSKMTTASYAQYYDTITSIEIGEGITSTGNRAFEGMPNVTSVSIPASLQTISDFTFDRMPSLSNVTIADDSNLKEINYCAFQLTSSLTNQSAQNAINIAAANNKADNTDFVLGDYAFNKANLTEITIPDNISSIGKYAFNQNQLSSLEIPDSVINIGDYAFSSQGYFDGDNQWVQTLKEVEFGDSLESIGRQAFFGNDLTSLELPDSLNSIGYGAFVGNRLTSLIMSDSADVATYAFTFNDANAEVVCRGEVATCKSILEELNGGGVFTGITYNASGIKNISFDSYVKGYRAGNVVSAGADVCNALKHYYDGTTCLRKPANANDMLCAAGYYFNSAEECIPIKTRFTMPEADALTTNDNNNWVEWTFE